MPEPTANPTPSPSATPVPASEPSRVASFSISGFRPGSAILQPSSRKTLRGLSLKAEEISKVILTGCSEGPTVLSVDSGLAKKRAEAVRAELQDRLGKDVQIEIRTRTLTKVGAQYRSVQISVWP
jgi:outer membrane protein OmpA-like peptidoglycan-associated protein